jgi:predicted aspartyl protease
MQIRIENGLAYVIVRIAYRDEEIMLDKVIIDTGSSGTLFSLDKLENIGIKPEPNDLIHRISGIGGSEFVFVKQIDKISVGELQLANFDIEIGSMDYGFDLDGIIGMDFLLQTNAIIDLSQLEIYQLNEQIM